MTKLNTIEQPVSNIEELQTENKLLLSELETAYKNMAMILEQSEKEKAIAYKELEQRYAALEEIYQQLSNKENMLIHLEKLSSIGQFITEIIHELKNPLTVISGMVDLVLMDTELRQDMRKRLEKVPPQVSRMLSYLNRFKSMAYKSKEDFKLFNINDNIQEFLTTIDIIKPKSIKIKADICSDNMYVMGDPYQTMQIYLNMAKNAFDAMKNNGSTFRVTCRKVNKDWILSDEMSAVTCQQEEIWEENISGKSEFVLIEFADDGSGIPEELVNDIFEVFFTTKGRGQGTGLGLSIASDIVKRHNANLAVKSKFGKGTTFQCVIPLADIESENEV